METLQNIAEYQVSEIQISYHPAIKASLRPKVSCSKDAHRLLIDSWELGTLELIEQFKIILLNRASRALGISTVSTGGMTACIADPKIIFATALKAGATSIILAHNHPSGNLKPSQMDINLTHKLVTGGNMLDISVVEHIIVTADGYLSFVDEGII